MNTYILDILAIAIALLCIRSLVLWRKRASHVAPFPPGPRGLPIVGNILDMPGKDEWETARQWGEKYGDLISVKNFVTRYVFVNSYETAVDLLDKRGNIYSTRPQVPMTILEGWTEWFATIMPYGDELRRIRQFMHRFFHQSVTKDYFEVQEQSTHDLLFKILERPAGFRDHIRHWAAQSIVMIAYGYEVIEDDPYIDLVGRGMEAFTEAQTFFLVNALPALQHLPPWFPGTGFLKRAKEGYGLSKSMRHGPYDKAKKLIANGGSVPSMTSKLIDAQTKTDGSILDEGIIEKAVGVAYAGAGDSSVAALLTFLLATLLHPEVVRKGQEEIDRVVGKDTLPTLEDRAKLPYINAIVHECLRWQTVAAIGVAHCAEKDDVYNGYFIPAGTVVFANIWAMLRNPKDYPEPDKFIPDRWLVENPPRTPTKIAFGFGRRICPGRFFAENSLFIGVASMLAVFNIEKEVDASGVPIPPVVDYTSNIIRHPRPFKCKITPRSEEVAALVRATRSAMQ